MDKKALARMIDHTLLKPAATEEQIAKLCQEGQAHHFASVCVNPVHVEQCAELLEGSDVAVCTVAGFPLGATPTEVKVFEALRAIHDGAPEVDMVINIGALQGGHLDLVREDIAALARACHASDAMLKVIIEAALLTDDEKTTACQLAQEAGADFVKTSTGFGPGGATLEDGALMRSVGGPERGVKAAGGIHSYEEAVAMVEAGASRIGASRGVEIVSGS